MNTKLSLMCRFILLAILTACTGQPTAAPSRVDPKNTESIPATEPQNSSVEDFDSLVNALKSAGATVEPGDEIEQVFLAVTDRIIKVNGADVQVFEYASSDAMEADAAQASEDGSSIGTTMVTWMEAPHFFQAGQIIVLYVGTDQVVLDLLESTLGEQFAGR